MARCIVRAYWILPLIQAALLIRIYWPFNISAISHSQFAIHIPTYPFSYQFFAKILRIKVSANKLQATNEQIPFLISSCHCLLLLLLLLFLLLVFFFNATLSNSFMLLSRFAAHFGCYFVLQSLSAENVN